MTQPQQALDLTPVRPVSHITDGQVIVIRSQFGSAITGHVSECKAVVCDQADDIDPVRHARWSMAATGIARLVTEPCAANAASRRSSPRSQSMGW